MTDEDPICHKCKGEAHYTITLRSISGKDIDGCGKRYLVACDAPACHNGRMDREEYYKQWNLESK
jgi:hypothetical protein